MCTSSDMDSKSLNKSKEQVVNKQVKNIDQQVMSILKTVLERCKKEKSSNCLQVPLEDYYERVSYYTAFPKMLIYHVIDDNHCGEDNFHITDHILLLQCMNIFLGKGSHFNIKDLYEKFLKCKNKVCSDNKYMPDLSSFVRKMYSLGYLYKKNLKGPPSLLIENPKLKFERYNYLYRIKNYRDNKKQIYYLDEKLISRLPFKNPSKDYPSKLLDGFIFFHLISSNGYEFGIFVSQEPDRSLEEIFKKWMLDFVLYSIKPGSVIVMANNFIHGRLPTKPITQYHSKTKMVQWLRENNIPCDPDMNKPRLYELIEKCKINNEDYDIDQVFKLHGHDVLRLPTTFPTLTPTCLLWEFFNSDFQGYDSDIRVLKSNILAYLSVVMKKQTWLNFEDVTMKTENQIFEIDLLTEDLLENNYELDEKCFYDCSWNFNIEDILEEK